MANPITTKTSPFYLNRVDTTILKLFKQPLFNAFREITIAANPDKVLAINSTGDDLVWIDDNPIVYTTSVPSGTGDVRDIYVYTNPIDNTSMYRYVSGSYSFLGSLVRYNTHELLFNISVGENCFSINTSGHDNIAFGENALKRNTTGQNNIAIGGDNFNNVTANSGSNIFDNVGSFNVALAVGALKSNINGSNNTAIGFRSMFSNTSGSDNVAFGNQSLFFNTTGGRNIAFGNQVLHTNTIGNDNIAFGYQASYINTTGNNNIAFGYQSLFSNTIGVNNVAIGQLTLYKNISGAYNVGIGFDNFNSDTMGDFNTGDNNIAIGYQSSKNNTSGFNNVAIGYQAAYSNTSGFSNISIGDLSFFSSATGDYNIGIGYGTLSLADGSSSNIAIGNNAMSTSHSDNNDSNIAIGNSAMLNATGLHNIGIGFATLSQNNPDGNGGSNVSIGDQVLYNNINGIYNTCVGSQSITISYSGSYNVVLGAKSLGFNETPVFDLTPYVYHNNITVGSFSTQNVVDGSYNIVIGDTSGNNIISGNNNLYIGNSLGLSTNVNESNTTRIGNFDPNNSHALITQKTFIHGIYGVTTGSSTTGTVIVDDNGQLGTIQSSRRYKNNISDMEPALSNKIHQLRPVTFTYNNHTDLRLQYGLVAEEVYNIFPDMVILNTNNEPESIQDYKLPPLLLNEIINMKKLYDAKIKQLEDKINALMSN